MNDGACSVKRDAGSTLVCFALKEEAAAFRKRISSRADITILLTGIGRANAERAIRDSLKQFLPRTVFTCGFAGGLNDRLTIGDVIFASADERLSELLKRTGALPAKFTCTTRIATMAVEKQQLRATTQADAVEMESEIIQSVCREHQIPCATVRAISDTAQEDLPLDFNALSNPDQSLNFGKLAWTIMKSPGKIPALRQLQQNTKFAAERLAQVLEQMIARTDAVGTQRSRE